MTFLFSLAPRCMDTPDIESFSSYVRRLTEAHGITLIQLRSLLDSWWNRCHDGRPPFRVPAAIEQEWIDGFGKDVDSLVAVFEAATGRTGLKAMTLSSLRDVSGHPCNGAFGSRGCCPACMLEWISRDEPPYFKLIWQLDYIDRCVEHQVTLISSCTRCGASMNQASCLRSPLHCRACGKNPYDNYHEWISAPNATFGERDAMDLVAFCSSNAEVVFEANAPFEFFNMRQHFEFDHVVKKKIGEVFHRNSSGFTRPRVNTLLRIAAYFGVPLIEILRRPMDAARMQNLPIPTAELSAIEPRRRVPGNIRFELVSRLRARYLSEEIEPSASEICRSLGVSASFGEYWCGPLMEAIRRKRHRLLKGRLLLRLDEARTQIDQEIVDTAIRLCGTIKKAERCIAQATALPIHVVRHRVMEVRVARNMRLRLPKGGL